MKRYFLSIILCLCASCAWAFSSEFAGALMMGSYSSKVYLVNSSFDSSITPWTNSGATEVTWEVDGTIVLLNGAYASTTYTGLTLTSGVTYHYSFDVVSLAGTNISFRQGTTTVVTSITSTGTNTGTFIGDGTSTLIRFMIDNGTAGHTLKLDNVMLWTE